MKQLKGIVLQDIDEDHLELRISLFVDDTVELRIRDAHSSLSSEHIVRVPRESLFGAITLLQDASSLAD